jgi:hypothetical protein
MRKIKEIVPKSRPNGKPTISFTKSGAIRFSKASAEMLDLEPGMFVKFYQDEDSPLDWFVKVEKEGLPIRKATQSEKYPAFAANCASISNMLLNQVGFTKFTRALVSVNGEDGYHLIILKSAVGE